MKYGEDGDGTIDPKDVLLGDPIVGNESVTLTEHGPGVIDPRIIPSPKSMSPSLRAKHWAAGHLPYDPGCEICVQCKRTNVPHIQSKQDSRDIPLLVGDYGFNRDSVDQDCTTTLV